MKRISLFVAIASISVLFGCSKKNEVKQSSPLPNPKALATETVSLTPAEVCDPVLDETNDHYKYNCAYYQLADAMRACMTDNILQYIYDEQMDKINNNPDDLEVCAVYYEDLFNEFPTLESSINTYLATTTYTGLTYEYNNFSAIEAAFVWNGEIEKPAVWITDIDLLPVNYTASAQNYTICAPIQIDLEDLDSEDRIFAWDYINGVMSTISIGETAAKNITSGGVNDRPGASAVVISGGAAIGLWVPSPTQSANMPLPPFNTSVPANHYAKINRIRINDRYDRNKYAEVKYTALSSNYFGALQNRTLIKNVKDVHKDDVNTDVWLSNPVEICSYIGPQDDLLYIYNMYEFDWYGTPWPVGFAGGNKKFKLEMKAAHSLEFYGIHRDQNKWDNPNAAITHPVCVQIWNNSSILHIGHRGSQILISDFQ